jgi:hypothetical protein
MFALKSLASQVRSVQSSLAYTATQILMFCLIAPALSGQIEVRTDLQVSDVYFSATTGLLYVTTTKASPDAPNSLLAINPTTGTDVWQAAANGDTPGEIAGSDDGNYAYVYVQSSGAIVRFNLQSHQIDLRFSATMTGAPSDATVSSMKVAQGDPNTVAVAFVDPASSGAAVGIALFHSGTELPNTVPGNTGCATLAYGANPATMWCPDNADTLHQLSITANGIQTVGSGLPGLAFGFSQTPQFYNGRLFFNALGLIVDPVQLLQVAMFPYVGTPTGDFLVDPEAGVVYFSRANNVYRYFWVMDANRFTPLAFVDTTQAQGNLEYKWIQHSMVRCGAGGLAGVNESSQLVLVPLNVITPLASVTPGSPTNGPQGVIRLSVPNQDLSYSPVSGKLYVSVPDSVPGLGNSILPLDPASLKPSAPLWIGSRPSAMGVTQDGLHMYQELDGSNIIRRINLTTFEPDLDTLLYTTTGYPAQVESFAPLP